MLMRECLCLCYAYEALVRTGLKCEARIIPAKTKCEAQVKKLKTTLEVMFKAKEVCMEIVTFSFMSYFRTCAKSEITWPKHRSTNWHHHTCFTRCRRRHRHYHLQMQKVFI